MQLALAAAFLIVMPLTSLAWGLGVVLVCFCGWPVHTNADQAVTLWLAVLFVHFLARLWSGKPFLADWSRNVVSTDLELVLSKELGVQALRICRIFSADPKSLAQLWKLRGIKNCRNTG